MKNKIFIAFVLILTAAAFTISMSQSVSSVKEKLKKLTGDVQKIVISTDDGEVTLEGDEAKEAYKKLNHLYGDKSWTFEISDDEEGDDEKVFVIKKSGDDDFNWVSVDGNKISSKVILDELKGNSKTIEISIEDGNKKVTVTTKKDGESTTKIYEGDEAEEYLEKMESDDKVHIFEFKDDDATKEKVKIIIEKKNKED